VDIVLSSGDDDDTSAGEGDVWRATGQNLAVNVLFVLRLLDSGCCLSSEQLFVLGSLDRRRR